MMALVKRTRDELDWPTWFGQRLVDWPDSWRDALEHATLKVEEYQDGTQLVVRAEMPGIDPDKDVEITMSDHTLHLRAERRSETRTDDKDKKRYRSEFRYGSFARSVRLPAGASTSDVKATYTDGILEVRIPMDTAEAEAHKIPIARS
jgi:HSP20 family protein